MTNQHLTDSSSQYELQMQIQAQQEYYNSLTTKNDPIYTPRVLNHQNVRTKNNSHSLKNKRMQDLYHGLL